MRALTRISLILVLGALPVWVTAAGNVDWATYGNGYANQRHSALQQINRDNVDRLALSWKFSTGIKASFQTSPIVVDGVMYLSTPFNDVVALNAVSGKQLWRYRHDPTTRKTCCGPANRGVAVKNGRVFQATIDGRLIALDQESGDKLWDVTVPDLKVNIQETLEDVVDLKGLGKATASGGTGHSFNMAPQIYKDMVIVGSTGAGYGLHLDTDEGLKVVGVGDGRTGLRGFLAAFDVRSGEELWRWYSVPGPEWVGQWRETTEDGLSLNRDIAREKELHKRYSHTWKLGGGSVWTTPAIDIDTGLLFAGTGNPAPNMDSTTRPGDNLYTSSIVAIDSRTGKTVWSYQQVPHDRWGYDVASPPILFETMIDGKRIKAVGQAGKTGWFYVLERATGKLLFKSEPFVPQNNLFADPTEEGVKVYPAIAGGSNWSPASVDALAARVYVAGIHLPASYFRQAMSSGPWQSYTYFKFHMKERFGTVTAIDLNNGRVDWQHKTKLPMLGGVLSTAGDLLFAGEGNGEFFALNSRSGEKLWSYKSDYGVNAPPVTYQVGGRQYVAVAAGGNKVAGYPVGDDILVFSLPESQSSQ